jgi:hypothetical protein
MKKFAVFDLETDPFEYGKVPRVFAAAFYDGEALMTKWGSHKVVMDWLCPILKNFEGVVYAHNGGKFDILGFVIPHDIDAFFESRVIMRSSRLVSIQYGKADLRDSYAILPAPLSSHDKGEIDYEKFRKGIRDKYRDEILSYLRRDVESLFNWVKAFREVHGDVLTAAQAAMKSLHVIMGVKTPKFNHYQDAQFRSYYYGGRVTAWHLGEFTGDYFYIDLNSAYPWAMTLQHPFTSTFIVDKKRVTEQSMVIFHGVARGCFPLRGKSGESLAYPDDSVSREYFITGWEYLTAKRLGLIKGEVKSSLTPEETLSFKPFVEHWHGEKSRCKKAGDKSGEQVAKITLNSSYGKFAQKIDKAEEVIFAPSGEDPSVYSGGWREKLVDGEGGYSLWARDSNRFITPWNVATAASISGCVRARLMEAKVQCPGALYCDTDSLIAPAEEAEKLVGEGLGQWELKAVTGGKKRVYIAGKKLYAFEHGENKWLTASKGVRLTPEEIRKVALGGEVTWKNPVPTFSLTKPLSAPKFLTRKISGENSLQLNLNMAV